MPTVYGLAAKAIQAAPEVLGKLPIVGEYVEKALTGMPEALADAAKGAGRFLDYAWALPRRFGSAGAKFSELALQSKVNEQQISGQLMDIVKPFQKFGESLSDDRIKLIREALGSNGSDAASEAISKLTAEELNAAKAIRTGLDVGHSIATAMGHEVSYYNNYYQKQYNKDAINELFKQTDGFVRGLPDSKIQHADKLRDLLNMEVPERRDAFLQAVADKYGYASSMEAAEKLALFAKQDMRIKSFGSFERRILDLPGGFEGNPFKMYEKYVHGASETLGQSSVFGANGNVIHELYNQIENPKDKAAFEEVVKTFTGRAPGGTVSSLMGNEFIQKLRSTMGRTLLALSTIGNASQGLLSASFTTDFSSYIKTIGSMLTRGGYADAYARAEKLGVLNQKMGGAFSSMAEKGESFLVKNLFTAAEDFNRVFQSEATRTYLPNLTKRVAEGSQAAVREAERLGLNVGELAKGIVPSGDIANKAVIRAVTLTQGVTSQDFLPVMANSELGQWLYQLKRFDILWWNLVKTHVVDEALGKNNWMPMMKFIPAAYSFGGLNAHLWDWIRGQDKTKTETQMQTFFKNMGYASYLGIMSDITSGFFGNGGTFIERMMKPPGVTPAIEAERGISGAAQGKFAPGVRFLGRRVVAPLAVSYTPFKLGLLGAVVARSVTERYANELELAQREAAAQERANQ